jgi:hypothetical protein
MHHYAGVAIRLGEGSVLLLRSRRLEGTEHLDAIGIGVLQFRTRLVQEHGPEQRPFGAHAALPPDVPDFLPE